MTDSHPAEGARPEPPSGHTAIVHFHGMGSQRRYEEMSRLVDAVDLYLNHEFHERGQALGRLVGIKPRLEPDRINEGDAVTYIDTRHLRGAGQTEGGGDVRVYECYWAPVMAGTRSPWGIAKWMLAQVGHPVRSLLTPWWERHRLRRSMLAEMAQNRACWPEGIEAEDFTRMLRLYTRFEGVRQVREEGIGYFRHFLDLIRRAYRSHPETRDRMLRLARAWHRYAYRAEIRNAATLLTLLLALVLSAAGIVWSIVQVLELIADLRARSEESLAGFWALFGDRLEPTFGAAGALALSLASFVGVTKFLTDSMGDVEAWATYEETNEKHVRRAKVIELGVDLLRHVLADPDCTRVIVTSHSLGTSVAHDTVLELAKRNRAHNTSDPISGPVPLVKIRHFVTMGSPIDKIHYFFESRRSNVRRYLRVVDTLRGDISDVPFARNGKPYIHWVNYWDAADVISGPLDSPVGRESLELGVDNVHVRNFSFPAPAASHNAYFANRTVIGGIFRMAWLNAWNYGELPLLPDNGGYDYASVQQGPGEPRNGRIFWQVAALALPWAGLVALILYWAGAVAAAKLTGFGMAGVAIVIVVAWRWSVRRGNRRPL